MKKENTYRVVEIDDELRRIENAFIILGDISSYFTISSPLSAAVIVIKTQSLQSKLIAAFEEYLQELNNEIETL